MPPRRSKRSKQQSYQEPSDDDEDGNPQQDQPVNKSLAEMIKDVGCKMDDLRLCSNLADEFKEIKKNYFKRILGIPRQWD
jgi:hypothetical protein